MPRVISYSEKNAGASSFTQGIAHELHQHFFADFFLFSPKKDMTSKKPQKYLTVFEVLQKLEEDGTADIYPSDSSSDDSDLLESERLSVSDNLTERYLYFLKVYCNINYDVYNFKLNSNYFTHYLNSIFSFHLLFTLVIIFTFT